MSFSFDPNETWDVSTSQLLPKGNHVCEIRAVEAGPNTSTGGHPMVMVRVGNDAGEIRDWLVISSPATFGKFTALVLAAGVPEAEWPKPGEDFNAESGRVGQAYADKLVGRKVGVVVREDYDNSDPPKLRPEVAGYVLPAKITDDMPADSTGLPNVPSSQSQPNRDRVPF